MLILVFSQGERSHFTKYWNSFHWELTIFFFLSTGCQTIANEYNVNRRDRNMKSQEPLEKFSKGNGVAMMFSKKNVCLVSIHLVSIFSNCKKAIIRCQKIHICTNYTYICSIMYITCLLICSINSWNIFERILFIKIFFKNFL